MTDYIKRSDALNFDMSIECEPGELPAVMEGMVRVMDYIKKLPAADVVEVVHGEWLPHVNPMNDDDWACSNCGMYFCFEAGDPIANETNFCPYCGAKMDGGDHDAVD